MILKKDWEQLRENAENALRQLEIETIKFQTLLKLSSDKISEFPDEIKEVEKELNEAPGAGPVAEGNP